MGILWSSCFAGQGSYGLGCEFYFGIFIINYFDRPAITAGGGGGVNKTDSDLICGGNAGWASGVVAWTRRRTFFEYSLQEIKTQQPNKTR